MTDINLKTLSPDTSLPTTGFLFGADSQASTNPSVYSTQAVATTLLGSTSLTGDTLTGSSAPVLNLSQTWSNISTVFTSLKLNVTNTNSASGSLLMDLQVNGTTFFSVDKIASANASRFTLIGNNGLIRGNSAGGMYILGVGGNGFELVDGAGLRAATDQYYGWGGLGVSTDTFLRRKGAANLQLGSADAASPVAQKLSVQSVVAGTSNAVGQNLTVTGSQGTGSGIGGSIIFQTAAANTGGGATIQNTLADAMVIDSVKTVRLGTGYTVATLPAAGTAGRRTYVTDASAPTFLGALTGGGAVVSPVFDNGTAWVSA